MISDQLQRSLLVLKAYQLKYPTVYINIDENDENDLPPWNTASDAFLPLFHAYDTSKSMLSISLHMIT